MDLIVLLAILVEHISIDLVILGFILGYIIGRLEAKVKFLERIFFK